MFLETCAIFLSIQLFTKMFFCCLTYNCVKRFTNVLYFIVINIPSYCALLTVYGDFCYAPIVCMYHKTMRFQSLCL